MELVFVSLTLILSVFLPILFILWFIAAVQDFLRLQRKKLQIYEEMLESQKETNKLLRFIASTQRENESY